MSESVLTLYGGTDCGLCDQARALLLPMLAEEGWTLEEVNIRGDAELEGLYGIRIPVVRVPSGAEKNWPFSAGQVLRLLREAD